MLGMPHHLTTPNLSLATLQHSDVDFIFELVNMPEWIAFIGNRNIHTNDDALKYIDRILANPAIQYWTVRLKTDNTPIGLVTFIKRENLDYPDLGFAFLERFAGKGYAYEGSQAVLNDLISSKKYPRILATTVPQNIRSINLLQRLGFTFQNNLSDGTEILSLYGFDIG